MSGLIVRRARWMLLGILSSSLPATAPAAAVDEPSLIEKGQCISRLADCGGCHTRTGGTPFAGGLPISTPFGTVTSPNITPDSDTGIGGWSDEDFYQAVTKGIGRHGTAAFLDHPGGCGVNVTETNTC